jgi:hypothetical protein
MGWKIMATVILAMMGLTACKVRANIVVTKTLRAAAPAKMRRAS